MTTKNNANIEAILDEDDSDADHLAQLDDEETETQASVAVVVKPAKTEKPATQTFGAADLAKLLKLQPKSARAELRKLAKSDDSALLRVKPGSGYQWTKRELESVAKKVAKAMDAAAAQKQKK